MNFFIYLKELFRNKTVNKMDNVEKKIILTFEEFVEKEDPEHFWKDIPEISKITGSTETTITKIVDSFDEFCQNSKGQYTTRKLYRERTPLFKKFLDSYIGEIK